MSVAVDILAYWPPRRDSVDECTERLHTFLKRLGRIHPCLSRWYGLGRSRDEALKKPLSFEKEHLREFLEQGRNRRDMDGSVIDHLGFHRTLWNGGDAGNEATLAVTCGAYWEDGSNRIYLEGEPFDEGVDLETAIELLRATVDSWSPTWAGVCSRRSMEELDYGLHQPLVDWLFFHRLRRDGPLVPPARVAFEFDGGECIMVQDEPVAFDDPKQRARSVAVAKALGL